MAMTLLPGEEHLLAAVVANLSDDVVKLVYADWLDDHGDPKRAAFLREYAEACRSMRLVDVPSPRRLSEEWLDLIGFRLIEKLAASSHADGPKVKKKVLPLLRPALRMKPTSKGSRDSAVGVSKIGGRPDLPPDFVWPLGRDCRANYNRKTDHVEEPAGFMVQVNFAEIAGTQAARSAGLPAEGVMSLFCFQDADDPDAVGVTAAFFPDASKLISTPPPKGQSPGNRTIKPKRLVFEETLDLPETGGPWGKPMDAIPKPVRDELVDDFRRRNFDNLFGYARSTTGGDPTRSKQSRHLIVLRNEMGCRLHVQIPEKALAARDFGKITLNWVDFD